MNRVIKLSLASAIALSSLAFGADEKNREREHSVRKAVQKVSENEIPKKLSIVDNFKRIFEEGKVSGNIRSIYSKYSNDNDINTYATALGGGLKYELAQYYGFNAAAGFTTSHDIAFASGDKKKGERNDELSSGGGSYTTLSEAYINYEFKGLNLRAGRQIIDTPLADSDDIRMLPNSFEAYTATYDISDFSLMAGYLNNWQGTDAGLDDGWVDTGIDGTNFGGISYANDLVDASAWYYNINGEAGDETANNAIYVDAVGHWNLNKNLFLHAGVQYLHESEQDNSGVEANIYGVLAELVVSDLGITIAYNKSTKQAGKASFSGFGGGTLFTSMDTMIIDEITADRDAKAIVAGLSYAISDFNLLYAYGDFDGDADSGGVKTHIVEQNIGVDYAPDDNFTVGAILVIDDNKEDSTSTDFNDKNFRVLVSYNF